MGRKVTLGGGNKQQGGCLTIGKRKKMGRRKFAKPQNLRVRSRYALCLNATHLGKKEQIINEMVQRRSGT